MNTLPWLFLWLCPAPADMDVCLQDLNALPSHAVAAYNAEFGQKHVEWLQGRINAAMGDGNPALVDYYSAWYLEADWHAGVWGQLAGATNLEFDDAYRLGCLRRLRKRLGREAYYGGRMPAAVPLNRFHWLP